MAGCTAQAKKSRHLARADSYLKTGNYEAAKIEYMNVLRVDGQNAIAMQQLGSIWFDEGAPLRAAPFLYRARELSPNNFENRIKLGRVFMGVGQAADARKDALAILQKSPARADALVLLSETDRSKEDADFTQKQIQNFPDRNQVGFYLASANVALHQSDLMTAESALRQALKLDPKSASAHVAMAILYLLEKSQALAAQELKTAAELAPIRSTERIKYAEFKTQTGGIEEAKTIARELTQQAPDYLPGWRLLSQIAFTEKKYDESLAFLENIFSRDGDNIEARLLQAQDWIGKGDAKKAVDSLERLDRIYPKGSIIKYQLAKAYVQNNNQPQAIAALNEAIALNPGYVEAHLLLAELNLRNGNLQPAATAMTEFLKTHPGSGPARLLLADAYRLLGKFDEAAGIIREQISAAPGAPQSYMALGIVLREQKKNDEARAAFEKALELAPEDPTAMEQLVNLDLSVKDYAGAMQRVERQLEKTPQSAPAHIFEAKIQAAQGKWDLAEAAAQKAVDLDPNLVAAYDILISGFLAQNKLPQAIKELETVLSKNPSNQGALLALALTYDKAGDFTKARDTYEKLLLITPDSLVALNNLSYLYAERFNQLDKASELARKARTLQPSDPSTADTLGWIVFKQGDYQQAAALLQESANKLPDNPEIRFHLGMAFYMMGQTEPARAALAQAANATTDFPGKQEAQRRLELLGDSSAHPRELTTDELESILKDQSNDVVALMRLAEAYEKQGASAKSASAYERAVKLNPKLVAAVVKLAQLYAGPLQNKEKAFEFAKSARQLAPNDPQIAAILGKVAYQSGNFSWAYSLLQDASRQLSADAVVQHDYAWAAYSLGKVNEAQHAMEGVTSSSSGGSEAQDAKSFLSMLALAQSTDKAGGENPEVQTLLASDPQYVPALMVRAISLRERGEGKPAEDICTRVLQRFPDFAPAQKELAAIYSADPANVSKAYDLAMKARKTMPDDAELGAVLGAIDYQKKDYTQAIQVLRQSGRIKPLDANSLYYLGMAQLGIKQRAEGVETVKQALAAGLKDPWAAEARRAVAEPPSTPAK